MTHECTQLSFAFDDEVRPIPECSYMVKEFGYGSPEAIANEMVREAKLWQMQHPDKMVLNIIPPTWQAYISYRLNEQNT